MKTSPYTQVYIVSILEKPRDYFSAKKIQNINTKMNIINDKIMLWTLIISTLKD